MNGESINPAPLALSELQRTLQFRTKMKSDGLVFLTAADDLLIDAGTAYIDAQIAAQNSDVKTATGKFFESEALAIAARSAAAADGIDAAAKHIDQCNKDYENLTTEWNDTVPEYGATMERVRMARKQLTEAAKYTYFRPDGAVADKLVKCYDELIEDAHKMEAYRPKAAKASEEKSKAKRLHADPVASRSAGSLAVLKRQTGDAGGAPRSGLPPEAAAGHLFGNLLRFGRLLRALGLDVQAGGMLDAAEALGHVDIGRRADFYHTLRTLLVRRAQDLPVFDEAFRLFWRPPRGERTARDLRAMGERRRFAPPEADVPPDAPAPGAADAREEPLLRLEQVAALTWSARQVSRTKDFAAFTETEVADARALLAALDWAPAARATRRWRPGAGPAIDVRRAVRRNLRFGGEIVVLPRRARRTRPRPLVLLCDVSGSMERYSRMLLHFVHTLARGFERVETFLFSTTLTRVTPRLARRGVDDAVPTLPRHVPDWSGGTRIGEALGRFNLDWARRVMGHAPIVLLISDGWDRGEPARLGREMARLQRSCHRLVWLNPLLGSPRYRPLTRGMQAALPWIDDFLPVHNLASLESLAAHLNRLVDRRPARRAPTPAAGAAGAGPPEPASRRGRDVAGATAARQPPAAGAGRGVAGAGSAARRTPSTPGASSRSASGVRPAFPATPSESP